MLLKEYFPVQVESNHEEIRFAKDIEYIYGKIADRSSRYIFENRLMYSLTGNYEYIRRIVLNTEAGKAADALFDGKLYIYGAGGRGKSLVEIFPNKEWLGFVDANKEGDFEGYPVQRLCDFEYVEGTLIVISNKYGYVEIKEELIHSKKVPEDKIIVFELLYEQVRESRYFEFPWIRKYSMQDQIFMDLGCYDGIDTIHAMKFYHGENFSIYALEPDRESYERCKENLRQYDNVHLINRGIGREQEKKFFVEGGEGARFSDQGNVLAEIDTIDHIAGHNAIGFIKMDIEGYEEEALLGGAETIRRCKPILAICIYHKKTDVWKLPLTILKLNAKYQFYLGHYTLEWGDTVLYAVDPSR